MPYRGGGPGHRRPARGPCAAVVPDRAGGLRPHQGGQAACASRDRRQARPALPEVPTPRKRAPGFNAISWIGLLAPAGTPPGVAGEDRRRPARRLADESVKARLHGLGGVPRATSPQEFARLIDDDKRRYAQIIRSRKITIE